MGLLTRTVLLIALFYLSVSFGIGLAENNGPSGPDRLVKARYLRHNIAARTAFIDGGEVLLAAGDSYFPDNTPGGKADTKVGQFQIPGEDASDNVVPSVNAQLTAKRDEQRAIRDRAKAASGDVSPTLGEEANWKNGDYRNEIARLRENISMQVLAFNNHTAHMRRFALEVQPFAKGLQEQALNVIKMQESLKMLQNEEANLLASGQSLENQRARLEESVASLEDEISSTNREHVRLSELLSRYHNANPSIAKDMTRGGTPWVNGRVTWAGKDSRAGLAKVSIGSVDGLRDQQVLSIQRNGRFIGRCRVESIRDDFALVRLEDEFLGTVLPQSGDSVTGVPNLGNR